jgi:transposase-like protein
MPRKRPPTGTDADLNLATLSQLFVDENKARAFLESKRWPSGIPTCPHCGGEGYALTPKPGSRRPGRPGLKKCSACRQQFTVRVGTIFEESKLPLCKWLMALHLMTSSKKGVSSHQIARELGCTQKTAWFLCHRIRECMQLEPLAGMLSGTVEVDEAYVGGKPRHENNPAGKPAKPKPKRGRGTSKAPVLVLVERDGQSMAMAVDSCDAKTLKGAVRQYVDPSATINTDELMLYRGLNRDFAGGHHTVNHGQKEYVRYEQCGEVYVSTNTAESWFALLRRAFIGIHHQMSRAHLQRYCTERQFMWNKRRMSDGERMVEAIEGAEGKRLMYKEPTS